MAQESATHEFLEIAASGLESEVRAVPHVCDQSARRLRDRIARGDAQAIANVYDEHAPRLRNVALRLVGDRSSADDLVHEVFVRLPNLMRRYSGQSPLGSFLCGVLINQSKHHLRKAARRRHALARMASEVPLPFEKPDATCERLRTSELIHRALDTLHYKQRAAFILCEVEDYTCFEVAQMLDVKPTTVRSRLFHAKRKLRLWLERRGKS